MVLACYDPRADGDNYDATPSRHDTYFSVGDLEGFFERAQKAGSSIDSPIEVQPWGERSFYCRDPFGNKLCFVDEATIFTGGGYFT